MIEELIKELKAKGLDVDSSKPFINKKRNLKKRNYNGKRREIYVKNLDKTPINNK